MILLLGLCVQNAWSNGGRLGIFWYEIVTILGTGAWAGSKIALLMIPATTNMGRRRLIFIATSLRKAAFYFTLSFPIFTAAESDSHLSRN
jgi:hypothetical protein